jgi:glycosyl hydrolase family 113
VLRAWLWCLASAALALSALGCAGAEHDGEPERATRTHERWRAASGEILLGGIQVDEPDHERWIARLAATGFNTVAVTVYARQDDWDSASLAFQEGVPGVENEVRLAKAAGLRVVLVLRVALDSAAPRNRFLWHGMIMPRDDAQVAAWFDRYQEFALRWARIAETLDVDVLGIASELNALASTRPIDAMPELEAYYLDPAKQSQVRQRVGRFEHDIDPRHLHGSWQETYASVPAYVDDEVEAHRRWAQQVTGGGAESGARAAIDHLNRRRRLLAREWDQLIAAVRAEYHGELTYAANFDQYQAVGFWPALDLIGVNAYFPLRSHPIAKSEIASIEPELLASWRRVLGEIAELRIEAGAADRPVLFTELGYTCRVNATLEPWSSRGFSLVGDWDHPELMVWDERERSYEERALAVRALRRAAAEVAPDLLRGLLWWKLSTVAAHDAIEPFVLLIGEDAPPDPLAGELRAFRDD